MSRVVGIVSMVLVVAGLCVEVPQIVESLSQVPAFADAIGTFTSAVRLPLQVNLLIGLAAVVSSMERALRMRSNWIDELAS